MPTVPTTPFPSLQIGDLTVTAISDGYLTASPSLLSRIEADEAARMLDDAGVREHSAIHINCYLVRSGDRTVLIDSGAGGLKNWGGRLLPNLRLAGIAPSDIDTVLLTHAHPDHIGGLLDATGAVVFPQAELLVHHQELRFWQDDANLSRASERAHGNFAIARRAFDGYRQQLRTFDRGDVLPGISTLPLAGHTEGHSGFLLGSGDRCLLVWGDIVHFPHIQIARPEVTIAFDHDPTLAATQRSGILDMVSSERLLVAGMHLGETGFVRIRHSHGHYAMTAIGAERSAD
jgi:glyoxylase-like metal-dependent hydrolase (beta-lactamase superfamily II)